jgi:nitrous oxide reductase accessory protein NosL
MGQIETPGPKVILYANDEIQTQKFSDMNTEIAYWVITP